MSLKPLLQKINIKLVIIHIMALWMFIYAFELFGRLHFLYLMSVYNEQGAKDGTPRFAMPAFVGNDSPEFYLLLINYLAPIIGLFTGFIVSIKTVISRKWFWFNSLLAFAVIVLLYMLDSTGWSYIDRRYFLPGTFFRNHAYLFYFINASILLTIGLLLFFLKPINNFINSSNSGKHYTIV